MLISPIKCQGKKTKIVENIQALFPLNFEGIYYEPFFGSGVVGFNIKPKYAVFSDLNPHVINFYKSLQTGEITPQKVRSFLVLEGSKLEEQKQDYYNEVRSRFNEKHAPLDFLFLSRSCFNGMIRFNKNGNYNVPFGHKPQRFSKAYITKIVNQVTAVYSLLYKNTNWELVVSDFRSIISSRVTNKDFVYCDPPYIGRYVDYFDSWDEEDEKDLQASLEKTKAKFILSTWHSNKYRENTYLKAIWGHYHFSTREHFYHVGASEKNRNAMLEALVYNYKPHEIVIEKPNNNEIEQLSLFG